MARQMFRENSSVPSALRMHGERVTRQMFRDTVANGGTTVDLATFKVPAKTDGYFVGSAPSYAGTAIQTVIIPDSDFSLATLRRAFGFLYAEHLTVEQIENGSAIENGFIGTWAHEGLVHVDAVNWTDDISKAVEWARERGEHSIYDVQANGSLELATLVAQPIRLSA